MLLRGEKERLEDEDGSYEVGYSLPTSPDKARLETSEPTVTDKLLYQKHREEKYENSRL